VAAEAMKYGAGECPDLETIAAYLDGRLDASQREKVAGHLADCTECYFVFTEASHNVTSESVQPIMPTLWWRRPVILWPSVGAALATAAVLMVTVSSWRHASPSPSAELQALVAAVGTDRTIEPRVTGGFSYGPFRGPVRGAEKPTSLSPDVRIAAARIEKDAGTSRTQEAMRTLGIAHLVVGDIDRAITTLEAAANESTAEAQTLSDLAAAYLVRARRRADAKDAETALMMAERATTMNPQLVEAWFNRAYALEQLTRRDQAKQAWQDYLKVDSSSPWAEEARQHLGAL
jgi:tetratricopeptide (TPR) repeat protein